jgi:hypothetical protein
VIGYRMTDELRSILEGSSLAFVRKLQKLNHNSWCSGRDSNGAPHEYGSRMSPLRQPERWNYCCV